MQSFTIKADDTSPIFHYSPPSAWLSTTSEENSHYFQNTVTYTNVSQANVTFEFWGNSIQIFGSRNQDHGDFRVQIDDDDGEFDSLSSHSNSPGGFQQRLFEKGGLSSGKHRVVMTNMQEGRVFDIDFVKWETVMDGIVLLETIADDNQAIVYSGLWDTNPSQLDTFLGGTGHETKQPGSSLEFTFTGPAVAIYGPVDLNGAPYTVQIDSSTLQNYSFHSSRYVPQSLLFFQGNMSVGEHTVRITHAGTDSNTNKTLAIDFMNVYSPSTFEIRTMAMATGGGMSGSTIAAIIMGIIVGLLLFFIAIIYLVNRGKKLGQFELNIFSCKSWNLNNKTEIARRVRREDVTERFELDGGGHAVVMTSEAGSGRNELGISRSAARSMASVTSRDASEMGLISIIPRRNETTESGASPARPSSNHKHRLSFSELSVLNQPLVIPKSSMGIIGVGGATQQLNLPLGQQGGQRNFSAISAPVPIPLPPGLARANGSALEGSKLKRRETVLSWKPGPEDAQAPPSEVPPPLPLPETFQPGSEESNLLKEVLGTPRADYDSLAADSRISRHESDISEEPLQPLRVHSSGSEGSLRSGLSESDRPVPSLPSPSERSSLSIGQADLLLHRIPIMPGLPLGGGRAVAPVTAGMTATSEASELFTTASGPGSERSSTSAEMSPSRYGLYSGGGMGPRLPRERSRHILGPRMRTPRTPPPNYKRGRRLGESTEGDGKDEGEAL